jgi:hypothetical protein
VAKPLKIPVLIPDSRESDPENGSLGTGSTASKSTRNSYPLLFPAKLVEIAIESAYQAKLPSPERLGGTRVWDVPGAFSVVGEFARVGGHQGPRPRKPQDKGSRRRSRPPERQKQPEGGTL